MNMDTLLSIGVGIGLAAACGFRVFVPLLVVSAAAHAGKLTLASSFQWMGTDAALIAFACATALEIAAYYVPWLDNLLDTVATPAAIVAGTVVSASVFVNMDPFLRWTLAAIAGTAAAGLVQGGTVITRAASTATTGGLGNPLVSTGEWIVSVIMSVFLAVLPFIGLFLVILLAIFMAWRWAKRSRVVPADAQAA
jgi:hypothetical protein